MIVIKDLDITYDKTQAVKKLNLTIKEEEKVSIVGKSGCGKTSLLHSVAGLIKPSNGLITIKGKAIDEVSSDIGILLQKNGLFPWKKVCDNVLLGLLHSRKDKEEKIKAVDLILLELGILSCRDKYLKDLSGGQVQRVAIARALVQSPSILLMDEPSSSLDMITKESFQNQLHEVYNHHKMTTIIVTHDIEEAVYLGHRILVMDGGQIINEIENPYYKWQDLRDSIEFYELCLKVRQVMKS